MQTRSMAKQLQNTCSMKQSNVELTKGRKRSLEETSEQTQQSPAKRERRQDSVKAIKSEAPITEYRGEKHTRDDSVELIDVQPRKKLCRVAYGAIAVPLNNAYAYHEARADEDFIAVHPTDYTTWDDLHDQDLLDIAVVGSPNDNLIDKLVVDDETGFPWQVSKVRLEFKRIDYNSNKQLYTQSGAMDDPPVSPKTLPYIDLKKSIQSRLGL